MKLLSLELKILAPFLGALLIFAASAALYMRSAGELLDGVGEQTRLGRVRTEVHESLKALVDAETGQRGFLITGRPAYLEPYHSGVAEVERHLKALEHLLADVPGGQQRLRAIRELKQTRIRKLTDTIELRRAQGFDAARAAVLANQGKEDMDKLRAHFTVLLADLDARENSNLARLTAARQIVWERLWLIFALMGLMLASAYWVIFREVRQRFHLSERLEYEATHDALTGLPNRRFFQQWLERALAQARREQRQLALLYMDLDGFKRVNDECGHEMGDRLLRVVAQRFRDTARESDVLVRLGGDEFALLTPVTAEPESVGVLAERLIGSLTPTLLPQFGDRYPVGVSIGIAFYPRDAATPDELMHAADAAMYTAKRDGRNCYRLAGAGPDDASGLPAQE